MLNSLALKKMLLLSVVVAAGFWLMRGTEGADKKKDAALERTRKQVKMLDDLYKTAVVLITDKYVNTEEDFPAGGAAVALFGAMKDKGWHEVRLVDATGKPIEEKNSPQDDFEKNAVKQLVGGEAYVEEITDIDGVPHLRAATPVPVVLKKCVMCHAHYADVKEGQAIGLLSYTLKIE
ncbi:MAG: DUF3365 domain-containing protein [Planctomycetaceae bacterium]